MRSVSWAEGRHHALVYPSGAVLIDGSLPSNAAEQAWAALRSGACLPSAAMINDAFPDNGDPLGFALAHFEDERVRIVVRGGFSVHAKTSAGTVHLVARDRAALVEQILVDVISLEISGEGPGRRVSRRIEDGIVPAASLSVVLAAEPLSSATPQAGSSMPAPANSAADVIVTLDSATTDTLVVPTITSGPAPALPPALPPPTSEPATAFVSTDEEAANRPGRFARLWSTSTPGMAVPSPQVASPCLGQPARSGRVETDREAATHDEQQPPDTPEPAAAVASSSPVPVPSSATITPVIVPARACLTGHANPPARSQCRVCQSPLSGPLLDVPRPPLGRLWVSSGESLELVRSLVVGRRPSGPSTVGPDPPQLLLLPFKHVSSNHVRIRLDGWQVLVEDLGTTNGTYVHRLGSPPVLLTDRPWLLMSGDLLDLGLGVHLTFEGIP